MAPVLQSLDFWAVVESCCGLSAWLLGMRSFLLGWLIQHALVEEMPSRAELRNRVAGRTWLLAIPLRTVSVILMVDCAAETVSVDSAALPAAAHTAAQHLCVEAS
jgi:hypothetical protein